MNVLAIAWLALGLVWAVGFGSWAAWVAGERSRRRQPWFLFGAVLGPVAVAILNAAPPGVCARCLSPVVGWSTTCAFCGEDVRANPMVDVMLGSEQRQPRPVRAPMAVRSPFAVPAPVRLPAPVAVPPPVADPAPVAAPATRANEVPQSPARTARPPDDPRPAAEPRAARQARVKPQPEPKPEPAAERKPTYVVPPAAQPASARWTPPAPPVADSGAVANAASNPGPERLGGEAQLDLDVRRPMRLASCVFVEGTEALVPGMWYQLVSEGGALSISGPPGSLPNASAISRPLTEVEVKTSGDRLVVTSASGSDEDLRLVFKSALDWTPLGLKREVDARRRALGSGPGDS